MNTILNNVMYTIIKTVLYTILYTVLYNVVYPGTGNLTVQQRQSGWPIFLAKLPSLTSGEYFLLNTTVSVQCPVHFTV